MFFISRSCFRIICLLVFTTPCSGQEQLWERSSKYDVVWGNGTSANPWPWVDSAYAFSADSLREKEDALPIVLINYLSMEKSETIPESQQWKLYETGDATFYSAKTHGRMMASGEKYDKEGLFCAHKKLPFGTHIRVVNKKNRKEVVVVVKDRGPFAKGRVIDLSNKAAEILGMLREGVVPVELWIEVNPEH